MIRFQKLLREEDGIRLSLRNVSLSTCGIVPKMYALAEENLPVTLCVSLHAPNDEIRRETMPIAYTWSISEIMEAAFSIPLLTHSSACSGLTVTRSTVW